MTHEEAIEDIQKLQYQERDYRSAILKRDGLPISYNESIDLAIEALEKQTPKKPIIEPFSEVLRQKTCYYVNCPSCNYSLSVLEFMNDKKRIFAEKKEWQNNCWKCGQSIDWED